MKNSTQATYNRMLAFSVTLKARGYPYKTIADHNQTTTKLFTPFHIYQVIRYIEYQEHIILVTGIGKLFRRGD